MKTPSTKIRVLANGVFGVLHYGHLLHLLEARSFGDELWVSVTDDLHVARRPDRMIFPQEHRLALIKALRIVDKAFTCSGLIEALEFAKPHILVKGIDYRQGLHEVHEKYCRQAGIEIRYTSTPKMSATDLINESKLNR